MFYLEREAIQALKGVKVSDIFETFFFLHSGNFVWMMRGEGNEFFEHREYHVGDDIKNINWKIFARTDKLFTKVFSSEISKNVIILLDTSNSMLGGKEKTKFEYSKYLVSLLAYKLISERYNVIFSLFSERLDRVYRVSDKNFLSFQKLLISTVCSGTTNFTNVWLELASSVKRKVNILVVSDLLFLNERDIVSLRYLFPGSSIVFFQVLSDEEVKFFDKELLELFDPEGGDYKVVSSAPYVRQGYLRRISGFIEMIKHNCFENRISFSTFLTSELYYIKLKNLFSRLH